MPTIHLRRDRTSFRGSQGDEVQGSGYRLVERDPPRHTHVLKVAGTSHRREDLQSPLFEPGKELSLVPEPDNPHDPDAVGVWDAHRTRQVGYIPREKARLIKRCLTHERIERAVALWEWRQAGSGERIALEILVGPQMTIEFDSPPR